MYGIKSGVHLLQIIQLLIILIISPTLALINRINVPVTQSEYSDKTISAILKFSFAYFDDKPGVVLVNAHDESKNLTLNILKHSMYEMTLPVEYFDSDFKPPKTDDKNEKVFKPKIQYGIIFVMEGSDSNKFKIRAIARYDHTAKIIIIMRKGTIESARKILEYCFHFRKMLNIIVLHGDFSSTFDISIYDPFILTKNNTRGLVRTFQMNYYNESLTKEIFSLLQMRLKDVHQYPLRICMFETPGSSKKDTVENGIVTKYKSRDGYIMNALMKAINFRAIYHEPIENASIAMQLGYKLPNGTKYGCLRQLETGLADISGNLRPVYDYGQESSRFLYSIDEMKFVFAVPKIPPGTIVTFFDIFTPEVYAAICTSYTVIVVTWFLLQKLHRFWRLSTLKTIDFTQITLIIFGGSLMVSQRFKGLRYERYIFTSWAFFSLVNCFVYEATMIEHLTRGTVSKDIDTLKELAESDLKILVPYTMGNVLKDMSTDSNQNLVYKKLYEKQEYYDTNNVDDILRRIAVRKDVAMFYSSLWLKVKRLEMENGADLIHVVREILADRFNAHMVPLDSPFRDEFDDVLMKIRESGLMPKWELDVRWDLDRRFYREKILNADSKSKIENESKIDSVYTMRELAFVFTAWSYCCVTCFLVFLMELISNAILRRKWEKITKCKCVLW